jgi:hypothetical protein
MTSLTGSITVTGTVDGRDVGGRLYKKTGDSLFWMPDPGIPEVNLNRIDVANPIQKLFKSACLKGNLQIVKACLEFWKEKPLDERPYQIIPDEIVSLVYNQNADVLYHLYDSGWKLNDLVRNGVFYGTLVEVHNGSFNDPDFRLIRWMVSNNLHTIINDQDLELLHMSIDTHHAATIKFLLHSGVYNAPCYPFVDQEKFKIISRIVKYVPSDYNFNSSTYLGFLAGADSNAELNATHKYFWKKECVDREYCRYVLEDKFDIFGGVLIDITNKIG